MPQRAGLSAEQFRHRLEPLRHRLPDVPVAGGGSRIPFLIAVHRDLAPTHEVVELLRKDDKAGFTTMEPDDLARFVPIAGAEPPGDVAHLVIDVDTGADTLNLPPEAALPGITAAGRSPLTLDEGLALVIHRPDRLQRLQCFSTPGSRCGDRRVPAVWLSAGRPRVGWCWDGAPHTWLGSASCRSRLA